MGAWSAVGYDADGNRISRTVTDSSDAGQDSYSYDFENRLIGLTKGTTGGTGTYTYAYDYRTRRIVRDESHAGAGGVLTDLVFSGGTSAQEYTGSISGANLTVEYIRGSDYGGGKVPPTPCDCPQQRFTPPAAPEERRGTESNL